MGIHERDKYQILKDGMAQKAHIRYPLGSAHQSLELFALLVASFVALYVLAPLILRKVLAPLVLRKVLPPLVLRHLEFAPPISWSWRFFRSLSFSSFFFRREVDNSLGWMI